MGNFVMICHTDKRYRHFPMVQYMRVNLNMGKRMGMEHINLITSRVMKANGKRICFMVWVNIFGQMVADT